MGSLVHCLQTALFPLPQPLSSKQKPPMAASSSDKSENETQALEFFPLLQKKKNRNMRSVNGGKLNLNELKKKKKKKRKKKKKKIKNIIFHFFFFFFFVFIRLSEIKK